MPRLKPTQMPVGNHTTRRNSDWCSGCGLHHYVTGEHRADCTRFPPGCEVCLYYVNVHGHHRQDCPHAQ